MIENRLNRQAGERGSALMIVLVMAAAVAILLYSELPVATFEARRAKEQQLLDRGNEYAHAVKLYVRKFGRYPPSIDALEDTNHMRFLRCRYKDPFTGQDDWRLLHAGPGGTLADSKVNPISTNDNSSGTPETGNAAITSIPRRAPAVAANSGDAAATGASTTESNPDPTQSLLPPPPVTKTTGDTGDVGGATGASVAGDAAASSGPQQHPLGQLMSGGIAGVASSAQGRSIKAMNNQTDYSLWEFYYDPSKDPMRFNLRLAPAGLPPGDPATNGAPGFGTAAAPANPVSQIPTGSESVATQ